MRGGDRRKVRIARGLRSRQTDAELFAVRDRRLGRLPIVRQETSDALLEQRRAKQSRRRADEALLQE
jgi:hypothetical protein